MFASNVCTCDSNIWQLGALVVALAWINLLFLLRCVPSIGAPINLYIKIISSYVKLIYLPILLVGTFGFPFYMLFIRDAQGVVSECSYLHVFDLIVCISPFLTSTPASYAQIAAGGKLTSFVLPSWALLRTLHATTGDTGFEEIFMNAPLPYQVMGFALFVAFLILVLVLFNNLLVSVKLLTKLNV